MSDTTPDMRRNLLCRLPDTAISVSSWLPHPCGGYYEIERWCYGPSGRIGYDMTGASSMSDFEAEKRAVRRAARAIHAVSELAFRPWRFILPEAQERFRAYAKAALDA